MNNTNSRIIGARNEIEVLKALATNGWMTTRLIALWVYPEGTEHAAVNKAQRVIKRLQNKKQIKEEPTQAGPKAWILTHAGVERANLHLEEEGAHRGWAHHGYDLSMLHFQKHIDIVSFLIDKKNEGFTVYGKAALRAGILHELFAEFDAVIENNGGDYTVGVLKVGNCADSTLDRIVRCQDICKTHLIGDPLVLKGCKKKLRARNA